MAAGFGRQGMPPPLWLMRVVVLKPYTKLEVRRPCHSEYMAHDVYQH